MKFDSQAVWANARQASTEDLLNRVTVFRDGLEPEAVAIIGAELQGRGITRAEIEKHAQAQEKDCFRPDGVSAVECSFCRKPAVTEGWGWQRILRGMVPLFPRRFRYCSEHWPNWRPAPTQR